MGIKSGNTIFASHLSLSNVMWLNQYSETMLRLLTSFTSDIPAICMDDTGQSIRLINLADGEEQDQTRNLATDWASLDEIGGGVIIGQYLYMLVEDSGTSPDTWRIYRYAKNNLAGGATLMTFSGSNQLVTTDLNLRIASDGTNIFLNFLAGNNVNANVIGKYSISGTVLTYVSTHTLGSDAGVVSTFIAYSNGQFGSFNSSDGTVRRFNSSGTLLGTSGVRATPSMQSGLHLLMDSYAYINFFKAVTGMDEFTMVRVPVPVA